MAMRVAARRWFAEAAAKSRSGLRRHFSDKGRVLSDEERAAENVYIKKMEKERAEKAARQGVNPGEAGSRDTVNPGNPSSGSSSHKPADNSKTIAVFAGIIGLVGIAYVLTSSRKESREKDKE